MTDCAFCEIIAGNSPGSRVYEDDIVIAIMTIGPVNPGHMMVIPKKHVALMADLDEDTGAYIFKIAMRSAQAIRESGVHCEGVNLFLADGKAAIQETDHFHLHVFPRYEGDSFSLVADWNAKPAREELDEIAEQIGMTDQNLWIDENDERDEI
jgi:diadenosine tetraphosphate (Ap4A) HIT family hydrolase